MRNYYASQTAQTLKALAGYRELEGCAFRCLNNAKMDYRQQDLDLLTVVLSCSLNNSAKLVCTNPAAST